MADQHSEIKQATVTYNREGNLPTSVVEGLQLWRKASDISSDRSSWPPEKGPFTAIINMLTEPIRYKPGGHNFPAVNNIYHGMARELQQDTSTHKVIPIFFKPDLQQLFTTPRMMNQFNWNVAGGLDNRSWQGSLDSAMNYYHDTIVENETFSKSSVIAYLRVLMMKSLMTSGWRQGKEIIPQQEAIEREIKTHLEKLLSDNDFCERLGKEVADSLRTLSKSVHAWAAIQSEVLTYCEKKRPSYFGQAEADAAARHMMGDGQKDNHMATQGAVDGPPDWKTIFEKHKPTMLG